MLISVYETLEEHPEVRASCRLLSMRTILHAGLRMRGRIINAVKSPAMPVLATSGSGGGLGVL